MPHELSVFGIYVSPLLPAFFGGFALAALSGWLLARADWLRFFANPPWVVVALGVIYTTLMYRGIVS